MDRNTAFLAARVSSLAVALRKESVDRNICCHLLNIPAGKVALRKESVDRNVLHLSNQIEADRRSPQGERG